MEDIIETIPRRCGDRNCKIGWHIIHYWAYDDGTFSKCDSDGNHNRVDSIPTPEEVCLEWKSYHEYCAESGEDPLCEFYFPPKKSIERWQFVIRNSICGPRLICVRRAGLNGTRLRGRGKWFYGTEIPSNVGRFLLFDIDSLRKNWLGERWSLPKDSEYRTMDLYLKLLRESEDVKQIRGNGMQYTGFVQFNETTKAIPSKTAVKRAARKAIRSFK